MKPIKKPNGFTLIELLIVMAISLILMTGVYATYQTQQKAYLVQDQAATMQQNLRAAMHFIEKRILMAGYDPTRAANAGIATNDSDKIIFTMDLDGSGAIDSDDERMGFRLYPAYSGESLDDDLARDLYEDDLTTIASGSTQPIAENIEVLNFVYLDGNGAVITPGTNAGDVRSVEVTLVAKTTDDPGDWTDRDYTNGKSYHNAQGDEILTSAETNDNLRRMSLTKKIRCRNLGLTGGI